ncbi:uncharacterized protein LOC109602077 [Aethina tumida]|uniref:uncharacterized protein LOC109602077 n=1 Tax=Aethina tumida TaxID=116153 RepID=UPI00214767D4|nr:uncharacterized protein LOC109602077 [Aethina tumida]
MKIIICVLLFSSLAFASEEFAIKLPESVIAQLRAALDKSDLRGTQAIINDYADKLFQNLDKLIYNSTLDPLGLPVFDQSFLGSEVKLDQGKLTGLSSMHRYKDMILTYESSTRILTLTAPIQFDEIKFTYNYLVKVLFIPYSGGMTGKLTNFKMNYVFAFDFKNYHISLKASEIMNSGHIDLTFSGHIIDIVINLLSELVSTVLHPIIVTTIQVAFNLIINNIVNTINDLIDSIFHNDIATTVATFFRIAMKVLTCFVALFAFALADYDQVVLSKLEGYKFNISQEFVEGFLKAIKNTQHGTRATTAEVNEYVDKLLANIGNFIIQSGLDPMELPDLEQGLIPMGDLTLSQGWLQDTSTIGRYDDVIVTYDRQTKKYTLSVPLLFDSLEFTYDYKVQVLLLSYSGGIIGKVKDLRIYTTLTFDFNNYQASLEKFDLTNSGTLSLKFTGNVLVDWLVNAISTVVSTILHPIIIRIIQAIVKSPLEAVVAIINQFIDSILHPSTAAALL